MTTYNNAAVAAVWVKALAVRSSNAAYASKQHGNDGEKADHIGVDVEDVVGMCDERCDGADGTDE